MLFKGIKITNQQMGGREESMDARPVGVGGERGEWTPGLWENGRREG